MGGEFVIRHRRHVRWDMEAIVEKAAEIQAEMMKEVATTQFAPQRGQTWRGWNYK